jgi:hypothetical protein
MAPGVLRCFLGVKGETDLGMADGSSYYVVIAQYSFGKYVFRETRLEELGEVWQYKACRLTRGKARVLRCGRYRRRCG